MKKIFTLVSIALCAISANAQESWTVNNEDGTLKADYVANADPSAMSVVSFSTDNVSGTHTSGPVAGYTDGELVNGKLEAKVDNTWGGIQKKALSKDDSTAPFYYVQGKGNPVNIDKIDFEEIVTDGEGTGVYRAKWDNAYYNPDGTSGLPTNGTYVTLTTKTAGTLNVKTWINKGFRKVYIVKASDTKPLTFGTDVIVSGYINGQNNDVTEDSPLYGYPRLQDNIATKGTEGGDIYVVGPGNQAGWFTFTFNTVANETYYLFCESTQIGFGGYEFTTGSTGINEIATDKANANAPIYNLAGQRVSKNAKGLLIQNGKKYIVK